MKADRDIKERKCCLITSQRNPFNDEPQSAFSKHLPRGRYYYEETEVQRSDLPKVTQQESGLVQGPHPSVHTPLLGVLTRSHIKPDSGAWDYPPHLNLLLSPGLTKKKKGWVPDGGEKGRPRAMWAGSGPWLLWACLR